MRNLAARVAVLLFSSSAIAGSSYASEAGEEMHKAMKTMCESMDKMPMSEDINTMFVQMMIPHHQSAVDMSAAYLKEGSDPEMTAMAQMIIEAQKKEIEQLKAWLKEHEDSSSASSK